MPHHGTTAEAARPDARGYPIRVVNEIVESDRLVPTNLSRRQIVDRLLALDIPEPGDEDLFGVCVHVGDDEIILRIYAPQEEGWARIVWEAFTGPLGVLRAIGGAAL